MKGIDISSNNHDSGVVFNFGDVKADGYEVCYVKATQGNNYVNPYLIGDVRDAANNGLQVGIYHFYDANAGTPEEQAAWFLRNGINQPEEAGRTVDDFCVLKPVLDYETLQSPGELQAFLAALGRPCGVYTDRSILNSIGNYGSGAFGWLAWPGWNGEQLPSDTAIVQTGQQVIQGLPLPVDIDEILNDSIILKQTPEPGPEPEKEEEIPMTTTEVVINGTSYTVTYILVPSNEHVIELRRLTSALGEPATNDNTSIIDITDAYPAQVPG